MSGRGVFSEFHYAVKEPRHMAGDRRRWKANAYRCSYATKGNIQKHTPDKPTARVATTHLHAHSSVQMHVGELEQRRTPAHSRSV